MEKEQTPEKTTEVKSEEQKSAEEQPAEETATESAETVDIEPETEQVDSTPETKTEPAPEPEPESAPEPVAETAIEPEPEPAPEPVAETAIEPEQPPPDLTVSQLTESDPLNKTLAYGGFFLLLLAILLVGTSLMNTARYFVIERDGAVEIWQGRFSPKAKKLLIIMPGMEPPEPKKEVYSRNDVYPTIFQYYLEKSDALLDVPGLPDFSGIKAYLDRSMTYATSEEERQAARERINGIQLSILLYKADISAGKGTMAGLKAAQAYLGVASEMNPDEIESALIKQKLDSIERLKSALEAEKEGSVKELPAESEQPAESESKAQAVGKVDSNKETQHPESAVESATKSDSNSQTPIAEGEQKEQSF